MPAHLRPRRRYRHRGVGAAVKCAAKRDDRRPPRCDLGQFDRALDRFRAAVCPEDLIQMRRQRRGQLDRRSHHWFMGEDVLLRMNDLGCLLLNRLRRRAGWQWPVLTTAMPDVKSMYSVAIRRPRRRCLRLVDEDRRIASDDARNECLRIEGNVFATIAVPL